MEMGRGLDRNWERRRMMTEISPQVVVVEDIVPMMTITVLPPAIRNNGVRKLTEAIVGLMVVSKGRPSLIYNMEEK